MKMSIAAALVLCLGLAGCSHTAQGLKEDTKQNASKVAQALQKAGNEAAQATQKAANNMDKNAKKNQQANKPAKS